jgi:hypothetical protein
MKKLSIIPLIIVFALLLVFFGSGCSVTAPKLTAEDRKRDIQYLADWTRDYHPFIELAEKKLNIPSYEKLLPRYLEFAEQAETHEEFFFVVNSYLRVIGSCGHFHWIPEENLNINKIGTYAGILKLGITPGEFNRARYWPRLLNTLSIHAHPPFSVECRESKYFTGDDWQYDETSLPKASEILRVNGMTCARYLDHLKTNTWLKYEALPNEWVDELLMSIDEGPSFKGWQIDFGLPDGSKLTAFVPKIKGFPGSKEERIWTTVEPEANCTCLELTEDVGYIRIKSCRPGILDYLLQTQGKKDRNKIKTFLNRSEGKYSKLIIDVRNNQGGMQQYCYNTLISPFLDEPVTYSQIAGVKTKYLSDTDKSVLKWLRKDMSTKRVHAIRVTEIQPPEEFDPNQWTFYEVTRKIEPRNRYNFKGDLYFLMNRGCFSATDNLLNEVKRIGLATLVGRNTRGGGAGYIVSPALILPASGMALRVETELVLNPDGSVNELFGTPPDIELPVADPPQSITKEDLLKDEWIKWTLADTQDRADRE